jgi:DNA mismatch repair protein MutS2
LEEGEVLRLSAIVLGWPELLERLASLALTDEGKEICLGLVPHSREEDAREELALTTEMVELIGKRGPLPLKIPPGLKGLLNKAQKGENLSGLELAGIAEFLDSVFTVRKILLGNRESWPGLSSFGELLDEMPSLRDILSVSIDRDGNVLDSASPRLKELRRVARQRRQELVARLEAFLRSPQASSSLQDSFYTVREGRFVLPIRAEARSKMDGIVHDVSSSGATVFFEPSWLVELNNRARLAELDLQREVERILLLLSQKVASNFQPLTNDLEVMATLDCIQAKARLSLAIDGSKPLIHGHRDLALYGLRHPLLVLMGKDVVPNDVIMDESTKVLVISGPNAGGKTVILKALGLCALMVRAGIHIPAKENSRMRFFSKVFADMGDQQDLKLDFSTFSAHMRNLREILRQADEDSLVLLDEIAGSTDPQEGAALALAVLEELLRRGVTVVATTHYPQIKAWAQQTAGARNGAMEFDWERMAPTYRLIQGIPGQSWALEIARRMLLPQEVLLEAQRRLKADDVKLDALLRDAEMRRREAELEKERFEIQRRDLDKLVEKQREALAQLLAEKEAFSREKRQRLNRELQEARKRIKEILAEAEEARERRKILEARRELDSIAREGVGQALRLGEKLPLGDVRPGDLVEVLPLGQRGVLLDDPASSKGKLRVQVGKMEILVDRDSLGGVSPKEVPQPGPSPLVRVEISREDIPRELDLRGMKVEQALEELGRYLDRALLSSIEEVRIIHGHGTGALKRAVREWLLGCPWIQGFRPGGPGEGGDGATVVRVKVAGKEGPGEGDSLEVPL